MSHMWICLICLYTYMWICLIPYMWICLICGYASYASIHICGYASFTYALYVTDLHVYI